ncbi:hypothetical protein M9458_031599, partial [Cirrhinus mrigala]
MNCSEVRVETSVDKQLEPLLILEEGDEPLDVINSSRGRTVLRVRTADENTNDGITEATEGSSHDHNNVQVGKGESEAIQAEMNEVTNATLEHQQEEKVEDHTKMDKGSSDGTAAGPEKMPQAETQDKPSAQGEVKLRPKDRLSPDDAKLT